MCPHCNITTFQFFKQISQSDGKILTKIKKNNKKFKILETNNEEHSVLRQCIHLWQSSKAYILYLSFYISNVATY